MQQIIMDGRRMDTRADAHRYIQEVLGLPAYYGSNLDALADSLGELKDIRITILYAAAIRNALGAYGHSLLRVFTEGARGRSDLAVQVREMGD